MQLTFSDSFAPSYSGKLFKVQPAKVSYQIDIDADPITPEGKEIVNAVQLLWKKQMETLRKNKEKEYTEAIAATEKSLITKFKAQGKTMKDPEKWLDEEVKGANVMIRNAMTTFQQIVLKTTQTIYDKAAEIIDKKFKSDLKKRKIKAGLKIAAHVGLILVAGAVAILATAAGVIVTAATMGAGAVTFAAVVPIVVGALTTAVKSGSSIYGVVKKEWPSCEKAGTKLTKAVQDLIKAVEAEQGRKEKEDLTGKLGVKDKIKRLFNNLKGKRKAVTDALNECESFSGRLKQQIEKMAQEITALQKPIDELTAAATEEKPAIAKQAQSLVKDQIKLLQKIDKARKQLRGLDPMIAEGQKLLDSDDAVDVGKLKGFLGKVQSFFSDDSVQTFLGEGKTLLVNVGTLAKAVAKATS